MGDDCMRESHGALDLQWSGVCSRVPKAVAVFTLRFAASPPVRDVGMNSSSSGLPPALLLKLLAQRPQILQ